jgi:hypothetical protein
MMIKAGVPEQVRICGCVHMMIKERVQEADGCIIGNHMKHKAITVIQATSRVKDEIHMMMKVWWGSEQSVFGDT